MPQLSFFATCPKSIEDLLVAELAEVGARDVKETVAGVRFSGTLSAAYRFVLQSRFASRVLLPVAEFPAGSPEELSEGARTIPWEEHFSVEDTFAVDAASSGSAIRHSDYAALLVKDGIVDRFRERLHARPSVQPRNPSVRIDLRLARDVATISIDIGGGSLHRRGYRVKGVAAPMKENVAAAMLARARWAEVAASGGPLVDPMCGSGTLLIEGALIAGGITPGILRLTDEEARRSPDGLLGAVRTLLPAGNSGVRRETGLPQRWRGNDRSAWSREVEAAAERSLGGFDAIPAIAGFDRDPGAVAAARENAASAGLASKIAVEKGELEKLAFPSSVAGLIAVNPPYGERIAGRPDVAELYREIGRVLHERFRGWRACVLTSDEELSHDVGLRASRVNTLFNGPIRCTLAHFELTEDNRYIRRESGRKRAGGEGDRAADGGRGQRSAAQSPATPGEDAPRSDHSVSERHDRVSSPGAGSLEDRGPLRIPSDGGSFRATGGILAFVNRVRKNRKIYDRWGRRNGITCYRVYDADLPDYAVAIDFYEGRWVHVQEYVAPASIDEEKAAKRLDDVVTVLPEALGVSPEGVFVKRRKRRKRTEQYSKLAATGEFYQVHEGDCSFLLNFTDYLDTGLFLDHRLTRELIRRESAGSRFLNLFAYTCTATVYAVQGGAAATTSIDSSNTYLRWARENFTANGIAGQQHRLLRADCWEWLHVDQERYDLIFMDPPTFSNAKGKRATLDVQRDHPKLIKLAAARLAPGGSLLFSTNFRRFQLDRESLVGFEVEDITRDTIPRDFARNSRIHRCFRIRVAGGPPRAQVEEPPAER